MIYNIIGITLYDIISLIYNIIVSEQDRTQRVPDTQCDKSEFSSSLQTRSTLGCHFCSKLLRHSSSGIESDS